MKQHFLNSLERELYFLPHDEKMQILDEYKVHFDEAAKDNITVDELIYSFGSPKTIAIEYATELNINYSSIKKTITNTKSDSKLFLKNIKKQLRDFTNEKSLKRKNAKSYVADETSTTTHEKKILTKIMDSSFAILYFIGHLIKQSVLLLIKFFTVFLALISFLIAIFWLIVGIMIPLLFSFTNHTIYIWFLIYGTIFSAIVFFGTICIVCIKYFGRNIHE